MWATMDQVEVSLTAIKISFQELIFETFNIESKHEANEILMEVNLENLVQALRSAQCSDAVTVKLTKKQNAPFLTLDIEQV